MTRCKECKHYSFFEKCKLHNTFVNGHDFDDKGPVCVQERFCCGEENKNGKCRAFKAKWWKVWV